MAEYPYIQTSSNEQITVSAIGVSGIDGLLRIWIEGADLFEVMRKVTAPGVFPIVLHEDPELTTEFNEFTVLYGVEKDYADRIMVSVGRL